MTDPTRLREAQRLVLDALAFNPDQRPHPWRRLVWDGFMIAATLGFFIFVVGRHWQ